MSFMNIKEISENNKSQEVRKNEEIYYDLLYKRLINIIHEQIFLCFMKNCAKNK